MSLPKRCIPSVDKPSTIKVDAVGVGIAGTAMEGLRRWVLTEEMLSGGLGDISAGSGADAESTLFLRLEDEKFFLIPFAPVGALTLKRPGESGMEGMLSKLSAEVTLVRAGVAGKVLGVPSAGLGVGNGDEPLRLILWSPPNVEGLKA